MRVFVRRLSACLLALAPQLAAPRCLSTSITTAGPSGLVVDTLHRSLSRLLACLFEPALPACPSASLPCPAWLCWIAPAAPENPLSPPHSDRHSRTPSVSHSSVSCTKTSCLARSTDRPTDQAATSAPPRQSHQLAQALISPTCRLSCPLAACDLLDLAASATVSAPSPCDAAANNNNATASDQPFACGRPIHLATSSPNKRAHSCSFLA